MNPTAQSNHVPPALTELMRTLGTLAQAHRDLAEILDAQHAAMRSFDAGAMQQAARRQEAIHRRILRLEQDRRRQVTHLARPLGLGPMPTLMELAERMPEHGPALLEMRRQVREAVEAAAMRSRVCSRVAGSVLGHLNLALRLLGDGSTYRRTGGFEMTRPLSRLQAVA